MKPLKKSEENESALPQEEMQNDDRSPHLNEEKNFMAQHKYDSCLIISVINGPSTDLLEEKRKSKQVPTEVIQIQFDEHGQPMPLSVADQQKFQAMHGICAVDIHGHSNKGWDIIATSNRQCIDYQELAIMIIDNLDQTKIQHLRFKLIACHAGADSSPDAADSFALKFILFLNYLGLKEASLIVSPDMVTVKKHPVTGKIRVLLETELEEAIRKRYFEARVVALEAIKSDFPWDHQSGLPYFEQNLISRFLVKKLTPEILQEQKKIDDFTAELYQHILKSLHPQLPTSNYLKVLGDVLGALNQKLKMVTRNFLSDSLESYMQEIKKANHSRPFATKLFHFKEEELVVEDYYERKKLSGMGDF